MSYRTAVLSSFEEYLTSDWVSASAEERAVEEAERQERRTRFPYSVMLKVSFAEFDFANRWCWQNFGPCDGECLQRDSEYPACDRIEPHSHSGKWMWHWYEKIDYNFGFNEWYFVKSADCDLFLANVNNITWGENFPK